MRCVVFLPHTEVFDWSIFVLCNFLLITINFSVLIFAFNIRIFKMLLLSANVCPAAVV